MPQPFVTFQIQLGASAWDACAYVRGLCGDITEPYDIPDSTYASLAEDAAEDFSRFVPLDYWVGNPSAGTSPMVTVAYQQVYVCNSANGFTAIPQRVVEFGYGWSPGLSAGNELAWLTMLPGSPLNRFLFTPYLLDTPTERILRDQALSELSKYSQGAYAYDLDPATGLPSVALYPTPTSAGMPLYAHYQAGHVGVEGDLGNVAYPTVPEGMKRHFARLLYCLVLELEMQRSAKATSTSAGILRGTSDPAALAGMVERIRAETYQALGAATPVGIQTF